MFLHKGDYQAAVSVIDEYENNLIDLELPAQQELNAIVQINRLKTICYLHSNKNSDALNHISKTKDAQINSINLRKNRLTEIEYNRRIQFANFTEETFKIWHNIMFGNYKDARGNLETYKAISEALDTPNNLHNYYVLNAILELKLNNSEKSLEFFEKTNKFGGFEQLPLNDDYFTYYKGLALKNSGDIEGSKVLFSEIANKNFFGIQPALVRNLAKAEL